MIIQTKKKQTILSEDEVKILISVANGNKNEETAKELNLNTQCIKNNMHKIIHKLKARNNVNAVIIGIQTGILKIDRSI